MYKFLSILFALCIFSFGYAKEIRLAVAANVQNAFGELEYAFNKIYPDIKLTPTFGASGSFRTQIKNGANYDIFLSANMNFAQEVFDAGLGLEKPKIYAQGALVLFSTKKLDFEKGIEVIVSSKIKKIAIANPDIAPYGKATIEVLKNTNTYEIVEKKLIYSETIGQVAAQTLSAADVGFTAKSAFYTPKMQKYKEGVNWVSIDTALHNPINQGVVIIKNSNNMNEAKLFYDFLSSKDGKKIFQNFGYVTP